MTLPDQIKKESIEKIVHIANKMLTEEINLVAGCREIHRLKGNTDEPDNDMFDTFILVVSDTDNIPLNEDVRKKWNKEALKELDKELDEYIHDMKNEIFKACKEIISKYS